MKMSLVIAVGTAAIMATGVLSAQGARDPSHDHPATTQAGASANAAAPMGQMDEHMRKMQALHDSMMSAATPEERQKVMEEQRREMHAGMAIMNGMQGGTAMGGTGAGMMGPKARPADAGAQMQLMQKRMDMMQMMMQSMLDQQSMTAAPGGPNPAPRK